MGHDLFGGCGGGGSAIIVESDNEDILFGRLLKEGYGRNCFIDAYEATI